MIIVARFFGYCVVCHQSIEPGHLIAVVSPIGYRHADCSTIGGTEPLRSGSICPTCRLELPLSGACSECS